MTVLACTLVPDGSSDACLVPIIDWALRHNLPQLEFRIEVARYLPPIRAGLRPRVDAALKLFPCHILLVHRDAEARPLNQRREEIHRECEGLAIDLVAVVPVRMSEAWLLSDEDAIRRAANNPNGKCELDVPPAARWEAIADPKDFLFRILRTATELGARRRARFNVYGARLRVSQLTSNFAELRSIESFREFEAALGAAITSYREKFA